MIALQKNTMKQSIILLHGLFGSLSNWESVSEYFWDQYDIHVPLLPLFDQNRKVNLDYLVNWLNDYVETKELSNIVLVGNSLGGHVAILYTHRFQEKCSKLVLTGSSGLYENTGFGSYPRRHDFSYIREQVENTFYDSAVATDDLVSSVFDIVRDNRKCIRIVRIAKETQRNYVTEKLPEITLPVLLI